MPIKKEYNKDFFKKWSHDMAYILGFMFADGNITKTKRGNYYIAIYTADRPLLVAMRRSMRALHKVATQYKQLGVAYRIQIGSKVWFDDLQKLGLTPNKTKRMRMPEVPKKFFGAFLRGYFDGDGNVWRGYINKKRENPTDVLSVSFTSSSSDFLNSLRAMVQVHGIRGGGLYRVKKDTYSRLTFSTLDALKLHKIMYNVPCNLLLVRKRRIFEGFIKSRELRV